MLKKILLGLAAFLIVFLIVVALQPGDFRIPRSATIAAPPAALFAQANDLHMFAQWNPWQKLDPNIKNTYAGPAVGVGAACSWAGNSEVGEGTSTIVESKPGELVRYRMDWKKPMESVGIMDFTFKPAGDKTVVTWSMSGSNNFVGKAMCLVMNMDKMVGAQFEKGLANLAEAVQAKP